MEQLLHGFGGGLRNQLIGDECCAFSNCLNDGFIESRVTVRIRAYYIFLYVLYGM